MRPKLVNGEIYHICNKSIANFGIFNNHNNASRFLQTIDYYNKEQVWTSFSTVLKRKDGYQYENIMHHRKDQLIKILSYCIMPDHYHLLFKIINEKPITKFINDIENSYTRYFNLRHNRKGPLWQSGYRAVAVTSNELLLHISRYIHLNPTTSGLVGRPEDWQYSSFKDIVSNQIIFDNLKEFSIKDQKKYKKFVNDNLDYQKNLKRIKKLLHD